MALPLQMSDHGTMTNMVTW